jgi:hypothetical protein
MTNHNIVIDKSDKSSFSKDTKGRYVVSLNKYYEYSVEKSSTPSLIARKFNKFFLGMDWEEVKDED